MRRKGHVQKQASKRSALTEFGESSLIGLICQLAYANLIEPKVDYGNSSLAKSRDMTYFIDKESG